MATVYHSLQIFHLLTSGSGSGVRMLMTQFGGLPPQSAMLQRRWQRIVPQTQIDDALLLLSGVLLVTITHFYPLSLQGSGLTEKLFGVIICFVLGFIALGRRSRTQPVRRTAFIVALVAICVMVRLATIKKPLLGFV